MGIAESIVVRALVSELIGMLDTQVRVVQKT